MTTGEGAAVGSPLHPETKAGPVSDDRSLEALESAIDYCALLDERRGTITAPEEVTKVADTFRAWLIRTGQLPDKLDTN
jgi:hypothetical protein